MSRVVRIKARHVDGLRTFASPDFRFSPTPELAALRPGEAETDDGWRYGIEASAWFFGEWFEAWDDEINHQEEAQLWEFKGGALVCVRQWWTWKQALEAAGLAE